MCPSEYWSCWDTEYKRDIREKLHTDIKIFWTGSSVFARQVGSRDARNNYSYYGHELWLWDNIPVNDADYDRLFLDPVRGRYSQLGQAGHQAVVANFANLRGTESSVGMSIIKCRPKSNII